MRDVDLETAVLTESQVHPQGAFVPPQVSLQPYLDQTMQAQERNRRRLERQFIDADRMQQEYLRMFERSQADMQMQNLIQLQQLQAQLAAAQAAQQVPVQPVQVQKAKEELTEADIYDPSPVFDRPLKRVEGVEID